MENEHPKWDSRPSIILRPLRTCRQIYKEVKLLTFASVSWPLETEARSNLGRQDAWKKN